MNANLEDLKKIVNQLNDEVYQNCEDSYHNFSFTSSGYVDLISFDNHVLWDSENDGRIIEEETDEYEPLINYVKRQYNNYVDELMKFYFID